MYISTLVKKANRLLVKEANELLKKHGLADGYTYFLMALYHQEGLTQSEIRKQIGIEQSTAVRTLDRMERDGLIIRKPSQTDRRAVTIHLSEKAKQYEKIIEQCSKLLNKHALMNFSELEKESMNTLLEKFIHNLESAKK